MGVKSYTAGQIRDIGQNISSTLEKGADAAVSLSNSLSKAEADQAYAQWGLQADTFLNELNYDPNLTKEDVDEGKAPLTQNFLDQISSSIDENESLRESTKHMLKKRYYPAFKQNIESQVHKMSINAKNSQLETLIDGKKETYTANPNLSFEEAKKKFSSYLDSTTPWNADKKAAMMKSFEDELRPEKASQMVRAEVEKNAMNESFQVEPVVENAASELNLNPQEKQDLLSKAYDYQQAVEKQVKDRVDDTSDRIQSDLYSQFESGQIYDVGAIESIQNQFPRKYGYTFWKLKNTAHQNNDELIKTSVENILSEEVPLSEDQWELIDAVHDPETADDLRVSALVNAGLSTYTMGGERAARDGLKAINNTNAPVSEGNKTEAKIQFLAAVAKTEDENGQIIHDMLNEYSAGSMQVTDALSDAAVEMINDYQGGTIQPAAPERRVETGTNTTETGTKAVISRTAAGDEQAVRHVTETVNKNRGADEQLSEDDVVRMAAEGDETVTRAVSDRLDEAAGRQLERERERTPEPETPEEPEEVDGQGSYDVSKAHQILADAREGKMPTVKDINFLDNKLKGELIDAVAKTFTGDPEISTPGTLITLMNMQSEKGLNESHLKDFAYAAHKAGLLTRDDAEKYSKKLSFAENDNYSQLQEVIRVSVKEYVGEDSLAGADIRWRVMETANQAIAENPDIIVDMNSFNAFKEEVMEMVTDENAKGILRNIERGSRAMTRKDDITKLLGNTNIQNFNQMVRDGELNFALDPVAVNESVAMMGKTRQEMRNTLSQIMYDRDFDDISYDFEKSRVDANVLLLMSGNMYRKGLEQTFGISVKSTHFDAKNSRWVFEDGKRSHEGTYYTPGNLDAGSEGAAEGIKWAMFTSPKVNGVPDFSQQWGTTYFSEYIDPELYSNYQKAKKNISVYQERLKTLEGFEGDEPDSFWDYMVHAAVGPEGEVGRAADRSDLESRIEEEQGVIEEWNSVMEELAKNRGEILKSRYRINHRPAISQ